MKVNFFSKLLVYFIGYFFEKILDFCLEFIVFYFYVITFVNFFFFGFEV